MNLTERFHKLTPEQRKSVLLLLAVLVALAIIFMPSASDLQRAIPEPVRRLYPGDRSPRPVKRSPFDGRPNIAARPLPAPQLPEAAAGLPMPGTLLGTYAGKGLLPKLGVCTCQLELRGQEGMTGTVVGYSSVQCMSLRLMMPGARGPGARPITPEEVMAATGRLTPVSSILSGAWENGSIRLRIDKTIGGNPADGCTPVAAVATPFGARQVALEWQDAACGNWQMVLAKAGM
jgi:hypothetical protein